MARIKTALILLVSALVASTFAIAQDPGTYRPGQPYAASPAAAASICNTQCKGDAACRGWNFVRTNPRQKNGICEFNAIAVDPIYSAISVSANQTQIINATGQNRIISAGVRTTRIGEPTPVAQDKALTRKPQRAAQSPATRRIIRKDVPSQTRPQTAAFNHNLGNVPQSLPAQGLTRQQQVRAPNTAYNNRPNITRTTNGLPPRAPNGLNPAHAQRVIPTSRQADPRLQQQLLRGQGATINTARDTTAPQQNIQAPRRGGLIQALTQPRNRAPLTAQSQATRPQATLLPPRPVTVEEASQRSLYGHLNDDVATPKQLTLQDLATPNDQPIPTVTSVPVKPIDRESFSGLAGG